MSAYLLFAVDLIAICVLTFAVYFPRHHRRDLVVAFLGVNVGVLVVAGALAQSTVGAGLGLGLFGVLSIIRLRSTELTQHEVAYYFAALALGLLGGLAAGPVLLTVGLMALLVLVLALADSPRLLSRHRQQLMVLDQAVVDETELVDRLEQLLGARVLRADVQRLDLVNDTTVVEVRYELLPSAARRTDPVPAPTVVRSVPDRAGLAPADVTAATVSHLPAGVTR
ncbi:DUF4956 domain-containing protein [Cellulomonas soli]|uniref:DUF4956 domain-containing protein n=1 Tax=Cellulomonas soli TaxID=931535 RepID=A0A512PCS3_9CELL|nr:DUF4956 domain-containing protein [Cellulomonas soli]NYI58532.1 hypothetical protein [Cellulomonas soli]GEP68956.1 DUF4956 domain-containing protein [Cellulomonas soli]